MAQIKKEEIELIPVLHIKPAPLEFSIVNRETWDMLRTDMETFGSERIDPIRVRVLTPEEKEECKRKYPRAEYEVVDGHKRLGIAELLHWSHIRAIVMDVSKDKAYEVSYRKNKERGSVDPMLEALYFKKLYIDQKFPAFKIAEMFNLSERRVRQILLRVRVGKEATRKILGQVVIEKPLTGRHLEVIGSVAEEKQPALTEIIIEGKLSAKQAEEAKKAIEEGLPKEEAIKKAKAPAPPKTPITYVCPVCGAKLKLKGDLLWSDVHYPH